ncbi:MAG: DUF2116 family Zn-ribbon domain-containing protein [Cyclobacteriaceae bacterium]|nr:DUF2116 family Zn-ribbon domain-containing protein [Cyclobacteriaceae bacterium]
MILKPNPGLSLNHEVPQGDDGQIRHVFRQAIVGQGSLDSGSLAVVKPDRSGLGMVNDGFSTDFRHCPVCNTRFKGRKDKRYCSEDCRAAYNRSQRKAAEAPLNHVLSVIRKNRGILKKLWKGKATMVSRERLMALDFDPAVFSSTHVTSRRETYYFSGDYGFLPKTREKSEVALIVQRESHATGQDPWTMIN